MRIQTLLAVARRSLLFVFLSAFSIVAYSQECETNTCECEGDITEMVLFYFGDHNADISVYRDQAQTQLVDSYSVASGDDFTVSAAALPGGTFPYYLYFRLNFTDGTSCTTRIFSECPPNAWPGSSDDLNVLGKTFGNLTVFSYTSSESSLVCDLDDIEQDWHVGGNIVGPENMSLGTLNDEGVDLITDNIVRGVMTVDGLFGFGTVSPMALVDIGGDARVAGRLDVFGNAEVHSTTTSTDHTTGAVVVAGGVGIGENLNVGPAGITRLWNTTAATSATTGALIVDGGTGLSGNLYVGSGGVTRLLSNTAASDATTGALVVSGGTGIGGNLYVGSGGVTRLLSNTAASDATTGALVVSGGTGIGGNLYVGSGGVTRLLSNTAASDATTGALVVSGGTGIGGNLYVGSSGVTRLLSNTAANNATSGALVVSGGTGIGGNLYVGSGGVTRLLSNTAASDAASGALVVTGGVGIGDDLYVNTDLDVHGTITVGAPATASISYDSDELNLTNTVGNVRVSASNEEMMIVSNTQVEVKKRLVVTGADLAERFVVNQSIEDEEPTVVPGMVLSIDRENPGELVVSSHAYDKTVAGIASGAGGVNTAMLLGQDGTLADGDLPVAIVGRVYCYVDATYGSVEPGDMLTTSPTYGHAMKVQDHGQAQGAIIGKAMTSLENGKGLVLVLISMQ